MAASFASAAQAAAAEAQSAWTAAVQFPQLIDPTLDYLTFLLLRRLRIGTFAQFGMKSAKSLIAQRTKPVAVVLCTDAFGDDIGAEMDRLRAAATAAGVPVVHSLTRRQMGHACRVKHCLTVVCVMGTPDQETARLLLEVLARAAKAYGDYMVLVRQLDEQVQQARLEQVARLARHFPPSSPAVTFTELPVEPFCVPQSLTDCLAALSFA